MLSSSEGTEDSSDESSELILTLGLVEGREEVLVLGMKSEEALAINESTRNEGTLLVWTDIHPTLKLASQTDEVYSKRFYIVLEVNVQ